MKIDGIVFTHLTEASNNWEKDWSDKGDKTSYPITWATENNIID
jgi:hypothetical protein